MMVKEGDKSPPSLLLSQGHKYQLIDAFPVHKRSGLVESQTCHEREAEGMQVPKPRVWGSPTLVMEEVLHGFNWGAAGTVTACVVLALTCFWSSISQEVLEFLLWQYCQGTDSMNMGANSGASPNLAPRIGALPAPRYTTAATCI